MTARKIVKPAHVEKRMKRVLKARESLDEQKAILLAEMKLEADRAHAICCEQIEAWHASAISELNEWMSSLDAAKQDLEVAEADGEQVLAMQQKLVEPTALFEPVRASSASHVPIRT